MTRRAAPRRPELADDSVELRQRAESRLGRKKAPGARGANVESARLVHELEVHRLELEMQNAELRKARDEGEEALERYTDLYDFAPTGYLSLDEKGLILEVNLTGATLLGAERSRLVNRSLQLFVAPASQPVFQAFLARVYERPEKQVCEISLRREDGTQIWADVQAAAAASRRGTTRWCRAAVADVTALKRAEEAQLRMEALAARNQELNREIARRHEVEKALKDSERRQTALLRESRRMQEQLRQLSHGVLHAQEEERKRVSRELHDVVAQSVIEIKLHLAMLGRVPAGDARRQRSRLTKSRRLLADLVDAVHRFCRELRPPVLDDLGLVPALNSFMKEFSRRTGIGVRFTPIAAADRLSTTKRTVLYRVAQEAMTNVAKHAHATRVEVSLEEGPGIVRMVVADDGKAFDVERVLHARRHRRLGVLGMRERVEMVGGSFSIESAPGKGTSVLAQVPLTEGRGSNGAVTVGESAAKHA